jgi:hypothetical protein
MHLFTVLLTAVLFTQTTCLGAVSNNTNSTLFALRGSGDTSSENGSNAKVEEEERARSLQYGGGGGGCYSNSACPHGFFCKQPCLGGVGYCDSTTGCTGPAPPPRLFYIVSRKTGLVVDVAGGSCADGTNIQLWHKNGTPAQQFYRQGNSILNAKCDKAIDVQYASCNLGTNVQLYTPNGTPAQAWTLERRGGVRFDTLRSPACADGVLDVSNGNFQAGNNLQLWRGNGSAAQQWTIEYI